jgi:putative transposase
MTRLEDRQTLMSRIEQALASGARLAPACAIAGIDPRTVQRWKTGDGLTLGDRRPDAVRPTPAHALSEAERVRIVAVANDPRFADTPPARIVPAPIVPALADEDVYLASESTFHRVLRAHGQMNRRGRARPPRASRTPATHIAAAPGEIRCWDVTFLPAHVEGRRFYFYMILDLYSRKIVGFEVHDTDNANHAALLAKRTVLSEGVEAMPAKPVCTATTGPPSRPPPCWPCCTGSASSHRIRGHGSATTTLTPRRCSAPPSTGRSSRQRASPIWPPRGSGWGASSNGTITTRHSGIRYVTPVIGKRPVIPAASIA